jgi:iron(II)-dependent oxidoreductase
MPSAFISYRRVDSAALATLIAVRLKEVHGIDAYVDTRNTDSGGPFPDRLRGAIERSDVFVCLLGATTLQSDWVLIEIEHAHNLRKIMIPVFQERYVAPNPIPNNHIEALLQSDGVQFIDVRNLYIDQAIAQLAEMIRNSAPLSTALSKTPFYRRLAIMIGILAFIVIIGAAVVLPNLKPPRPTGTPVTNAAFNPSDTFAPTPLRETATPTSTLAIAFIVQTLDANATVEQATLNAQSTDAARATAYAIGTQSIVDQTATATLWTATPTPNITASIEAYRTQQADTATAQYIHDQTATATLWTATPTLTPVPLGFPGNPVTNNADWKPVYQTFNNIEMTLVPVGCFLMGSNGGYVDEQPENLQCFDKPFWIDRYEVTNKQFGSEGYFKGDNRPRDAVSWSKARDFCATRKERLPTEREWEYAARGPDNLSYPWGNRFQADKLVYSTNSIYQSSEVGSRHQGDSWVGASDLSGNVSEWVSSLYKLYPYTDKDGRESYINIKDLHIIRGGSYGDYLSKSLRTSTRISFDPNNEYAYVGFRCARDY